VGLALLGVQLALLDQFADLAAGHVRGLVEARLDELLVDVLEHHWDARCGDRLGDLAAHRSGADDGGSEHEHACLSPLLAGRAGSESLDDRSRHDSHTASGRVLAG